jgi:hypothetical protein
MTIVTICKDIDGKDDTSLNIADLTTSQNRKKRG